MLSDNDKQRIEHAALKYYRKEQDGPYSEYFDGAEYATLYERQQQADKMSDIRKANMYFNDKCEQLEAERAELRNKVIELVNEIDQLIIHVEEDTLTYSVLEHARKLVFKINHSDQHAASIKHPDTNVLPDLRKDSQD